MSVTNTGYLRQDNFIERLVRKKSFWLIFWLLSFSIPLYRSVTRVLPDPLPIIKKAPEFNFTNEFNKPFGSKDLNGKFYIANFMFTSCPTTCPQLMEKMDIIQKRIKGLGSKAAIVSFTVDPKNDTADVLYKYARKRHSNPFVWNFLTGNEADLKKVLVEGFSVPMGVKIAVTKKLDNSSITLMDIVHSEKVVLVDDRGMIRGYYSVDKTNMDKLMIDLGLLVNNSFRKQK